MLVTTVQPDYRDTAARTREFIARKMKNAENGSLILFPEYSNAGGISDPEQEKAAMPTAKTLLAAAASSAKENSAIIAVNVLEQRAGEYRNSTYLFGKQGQTVFVYDKQHLPPAEVRLGIKPGTDSFPCRCICDYDGIRFAFMTCFDVYFNEQIEYIASQKPDIILLPGLQRGERVDILEARTKMIAFRCNAYVIKSSFSMSSSEFGGCSMIVAPDGKILENMGASVGSVSADIDLSYKYMRAAGYGQKSVRNDDFIGAGACPDVFFDNKA